MLCFMFELGFSGIDTKDGCSVKIENMFDPVQDLRG